MNEARATAEAAAEGLKRSPREKGTAKLAQAISPNKDSFNIALEQLDRNNIDARGAAAIRKCGAVDDLLAACKALDEWAMGNRTINLPRELAHALTLARRAMIKAGGGVA